MGFIKFFFEMLHDMFTSGWFGVVLGIIILAAVLGAIGMVLWGVFYAFDSWFLPERTEPGVLTWRSHSPAHYQPMVTSAGNGITTTTMLYIPDSWSVGVRVGKRVGSMDCSQRYYDQAKQDQPVMVHYVNGRMSGKMYVKALS